MIQFQIHVLNQKKIINAWFLVKNIYFYWKWKLNRSQTWCLLHLFPDWRKQIFYHLLMNTRGRKRTTKCIKSSSVNWKSVVVIVLNVLVYIPCTLFLCDNMSYCVVSICFTVQWFHTSWLKNDVGSQSQQRADLINASISADISWQEIALFVTSLISMVMLLRVLQ